jgi:hypothetical protein
MCWCLWIFLLVFPVASLANSAKISKCWQACLAGCGERLLLLSSIQFSLEKQLHLSKSLSNRRIWIVEFSRRKMALPNFRQSVSNSPGPSMRKSRTKKSFPLNQLDYRNKQIQFQLFLKSIFWSCIIFIYSEILFRMIFQTSLQIVIF